MRCINARLADSFRVCNQITRTLDANTFFCLLRFSGHCCVLTTGASQQLVMTQYPQSLKQFFLFFCAVKNAAALLPSSKRKLVTLLWINISLSEFTWSSGWRALVLNVKHHSLVPPELRILIRPGFAGSLHERVYFFMAAWKVQKTVYSTFVVCPSGESGRGR